MLEYKPDSIGVSSRSNEWPLVRKLSRNPELGKAIKVVGGAHATVAPPEVLENADIAVRGEGEITFRELLDRLEKKASCRDVAGCWVKGGNEIHENPMRALIEELDSLPIPHWKIFDDVHYRNSYIKRECPDAKVVGTFEGSRGCPFACTYCTNSFIRELYSGAGRWRREKSVDRIIEEVKAFRELYGLDFVYWIDEVILTQRSWVKEFFPRFKGEIGVSFVFMERPENMTLEKVKFIRDAGALSVSIGVESGDEEFRKRTLNRKQSQKQIVDAFGNANRVGLRTHAFSMVGFPEENLDMVAKTFGILKKAKLTTVQTTIFHPLIGTKLYDKAIADGIFSSDTPVPRDYYTESCLGFSESWKEQLKRAQFLISASHRNPFLGKGLFKLCVKEPLFYDWYVKLRKMFWRVRNRFASIPWPDGRS